MVKAPITKEYKTLEEIKRVIELEDDFHDAELMDMAIKNGDAWFGVWQYGHRFTFVCRKIVSLEMSMDLKSLWLYEVDIKQCEDGMELTFDEAGVVVKAKEVILEELILPKDYELTDEDVGNVYEEFKRVTAQKDTVSAKELEAMIASSAMQVPSSYHVESYVCNSGNTIQSLASVALIRDGVACNGVSTGDGPIDASFRAIEQAIGHHYELDDFQIQSVTEGREALGSALVKLRSGGKLYSGNGLSTDIVGASIRAYINALNKIVHEEE